MRPTLQCSCCCVCLRWGAAASGSSRRSQSGGVAQAVSASLLVPDLITAVVEPHEFLGFVSGQLSRQFVQDEADLERRLAALDRQPDPDGRFRVNEFFCHADTWQMTDAPTGKGERRRADGFSVASHVRTTAAFTSWSNSSISSILSASHSWWTKPLTVPFWKKRCSTCGKASIVSHRTAERGRRRRPCIFSMPATNQDSR